MPSLEEDNDDETKSKENNVSTWDTTPKIEF